MVVVEMSRYQFQVDARLKIDSALAQGQRPLCVMPTGAGKGTVAAKMLDDVARSGGRALLVAHRREIVSDLARRAESHYPRVGLVLPGRRRDPGALIQVASTQSLVGSVLREYDLIVADECHHYAADAWRTILDGHRGKLVGFTATPERSDGRPMGDVFSCAIVGATYRELIASGVIVDCDVLAPDEHLGRDRAACPVDAYLQHANGSTALVFVDTVDRAIGISAEFARRGVKSACIHDGTDKTKRARALEMLSVGEIAVVVNVYTMTEGIDVPRCSTVILDRNFQSIAPYVQTTGRALRAYPGKERALLIDLHGVSHVLGSPTADRDVDLLGRPPSEGAEAPDRGDIQVHEGVTLGVELHRQQYAQEAALPPSDVVAEEKAPVTRRLYWRRLNAEVSKGVLSMSDAMSAFNAKYGRVR